MINPVIKDFVDTLDREQRKAFSKVILVLKDELKTDDSLVVTATLLELLKLVTKEAKLYKGLCNLPGDCCELCYRDDCEFRKRQRLY